MNANSSSSESKWVDWPDTTCSTRPSIRPCAMFVLRRKCTTNAQWTDKGAFPVCCGGMLGLRLCFALAIARVLCQDNTSTGGRSLRKTLGFVWDYFRTRDEQKMQADRLLIFGSYRWDPHTGQLWRGKQEVSLTGKASAVLRSLVERAGQLVTKDELFAAVWPQTVVSDAALSSCIQELRQALGDDAKKPRYIETVHRRGFQFIGKVASSQDSVVSRKTTESRSQEPESRSPSLPSRHSGLSTQNSSWSVARQNWHSSTAG